MIEKEKAGSVVKAIKGACRKTVKYTGITLGSAFAAAALTVGATYKMGLGTETYEEYGEREGVPTEIVQNTKDLDTVRVYEKNTAGYLYKVGQYTAMDMMFAEQRLGEDASWLKKTWTQGVTGAHSLLVNASYHYDAHFNQHPLGANALRGNWTPDGNCYINAPGEFEDMAVFAYYMTGIHPGYLTDLQGKKDIDPKIPVMIHEVSHCVDFPEPRSIHDVYAPTSVLGGEVAADDDAHKAMIEYFKNADASEDWYHIRAVSALSHPLGFGASHSTSPLVQSPLNDGHEYSKEEIYAAYVYLNLLVKDLQADIHPYFGLHPMAGQDIYFLDTYVKLYQILNGNEYELKGAEKRAAQLYLDGVQHLVPAVKELDHSKIPLKTKKVAPEPVNDESWVTQGLNYIGLG